MIVPAYPYKDQIEQGFARLAYTEKLLWYDGCIENFRHELPDGEDRYQFAIVESGQVIGFICFRVDWYCSQAFNFGLMSFMDSYFDNPTQEYKDSKPVMFEAIRKVIRLVDSFNLHRIDFRCVSGNTAEKRYDGIVKLFDMDYRIRKVAFKDNIRDRQGNYHDTIMYELIRRVPHEQRCNQPCGFEETNR